MNIAWPQNEWMGRDLNPMVYESTFSSSMEPCPAKMTLFCVCGRGCSDLGHWWERIRRKLKQSNSEYLSSCPYKTSQHSQNFVFTFLRFYLFSSRLYKVILITVRFAEELPASQTFFDQGRVLGISSVSKRWAQFSWRKGNAASRKNTGFLWLRLVWGASLSSPSLRDFLLP